MRNRWILPVLVLSIVAMAAPARAQDPLDQFSDRLIDAERRVGAPVPFTGEARDARLTALWPEVATNLIELRVATSEALSDVIHPAVSSRLLGRQPTELTLVPGVAFRLQTFQDVARVQSLAPDWLRATKAAAFAESFDLEADFRVCPIKGWHWFRDSWGEDRGGGRTHKGTDVISLRGMKLYSMEAGRIIQMGWHWAGGRTLYVRGDTSGDVYYYAHMDGYARDIGLGSRVRAGQHLGWVGLTGNADSAHLHLGWMPGTGRVALDELENPYFLLAHLCR